MNHQLLIVFCLTMLGCSPTSMGTEPPICNNLDAGPPWVVACAQCYLSGECGVGVDVERAFELFEKAAAADARYHAEWAAAHLRLDHDARNPKELDRMIKLGVDAGSPFAQQLQGTITLANAESAADVATAYTLLEQAAFERRFAAFFTLGYMLQKSSGACARQGTLLFRFSRMMSAYGTDQTFTRADWDKPVLDLLDDVEVALKWANPAFEPSLLSTNWCKGVSLLLDGGPSNRASGLRHGTRPES